MLKQLFQRRPAGHASAGIWASLPKAKGRWQPPIEILSAGWATLRAKYISQTPQLRLRQQCSVKSALRRNWGYKMARGKRLKAKGFSHGPLPFALCQMK